MKQVQTAKLVQQAKRGNRRAYGELVKRFSRYVFAVCLGVLGDDHEAEDVAQEVLIKGFDEIKKLKNDSHFKFWLGSIARNKCVDYIRERGKMRHALESKREQNQGGGLKNVELIREAVSELDTNYREPLMLYYFEDNDCNRIAEMLCADPRTVRTRLSRARKQLREILSRKEEQDA